MDYRILGETLPAVEVRLQPGEAASFLTGVGIILYPLPLGLSGCVKTA